MPIFCRFYAVTFTLVIISGCAAEYKTLRAQEISDAGINYASDMQKFFEYEQRQFSILIAQQLAERSRTETEYYKARETAFKQNADIQKALDNVGLLKKYFTLLGKLAKDDSTETAKRLESITGTLKNKLHMAKINDSIEGAVPDIGASAAVAYHGHLIGNVFKRDGDTVALALRALRHFIIQEKSKYSETARRPDVLGHYQVTPYVNTPQNAALSAQWGAEFADRASYATPQSAFDGAIKASLAMEQAWIETVKGTLTTEEFFITLDRFSFTMDALSQLHR